ncbi:MAG: MBL fold metallo-hydrolase [Thermoanaerobaculia bacterium]|nr:MBL fold metallo-hydrolase [Thermoanaerobaculia bacterium]
MQHWQIGNVKITRVVELEIAGGTRFILPDALRDAVLPIRWLRPHFADEDGNLIMSIHALVVETPTRRILVDTCLGNDKERQIPLWHMRSGPFLDDLESAGYPADSIDTVLCTHLHVDHVGWNTRLVDGRWVPTFENASYLFGREEWEHWDAHADEDQMGIAVDDSVRPIVEADLHQLVEVDHDLGEGVTLEPTRGHTPGHVSVRIRSRGEEALITGDFIHHPCQMARLGWCSSADFDAEQAKATRLAMLESLADRPVLVIGTHFATPSAGRVVRDGDAYRLDV